MTLPATPREALEAITAIFEAVIKERDHPKGMLIYAGSPQLPVDLTVMRKWAKDMRAVLETSAMKDGAELDGPLRALGRVVYDNDLFNFPPARILADATRAHAALRAENDVLREQIDAIFKIVNGED